MHLALKELVTIYTRKSISDQRGRFIKVIDGLEHGIDRCPIGEVYLVEANPGADRGGHYHRLADEWFIVVKGVGRLHLENICNRERLTIEVSAEPPKTIAVPRNIAHTFQNTSESEGLVVIAYTNKKYDPNDTIPYSIG